MIKCMKTKFRSMLCKTLQAMLQKRCGLIFACPLVRKFRTRYGSACTLSLATRVLQVTVGLQVDCTRPCTCYLWILGIAHNKMLAKICSALNKPNNQVGS